ncbi:hypothetical protein IM538_07770 [Cytobacillus suaedae]|nr:hypothetical protein IM538_07770 [Cytobacillus suaedae]
MDLYKKITQLNEKLIDLHKEYWHKEVVFTFEWWFVIGTLILPWIIWWKLVDKSRIKEISYVGVMIMVLSFLLDQLGAALLLWSYPITLTPLSREVFDPADFAILPLCYMMIYQYFPKWKVYSLAMILFGFFGAYVGGNLYEWLGIYKIYHWKHIYSVPIYFLIGVFVKYVMNKLTSIENKRYE